MQRPTTLAEITTLRVGGRMDFLVDAMTEQEITDSLRGADDLGAPLLVLGGGSNVVVSDEGFPGLVLRDRREEVSIEDGPSREGVLVTVTAGMPWDDVVARSVEEGWVGIEALSGIPGSTGATPVQNVGAYGQEVGEVIRSVRVWDRVRGEVRTLARDECSFSYRDSVLRQSIRGEAGDGRRWWPTPRFVVLEVEFRLGRGPLSAPISYAGLAKGLGVSEGDRAPLAEVRQAVLALRRSKGMVLDPTDPDTSSVGSFFTNPILEPERAAALPADAPRYPVEETEAMEGKGSGRIKTSAAWLIEHAGFGKGFALEPGAPASLSTKHALALTNRGGATAADILALARRIRGGVSEAFGVELEPEPVLVGLEL